ncbi:hypothetical protein [Microbaculum marinisediminis]|uniref:Uncharacterized protein n=1 Tax=Microbaculum marinisediminis TaxID=2931392 RepID=A0AAW5R1D6_9HYPH|nr:hypothetical protein [Microbaculum sp. A6E488]MCT8974012.1 hypothetical protein [Microbaculum sp. A6E488]
MSTTITRRAAVTGLAAAPAAALAGSLPAIAESNPDAELFAAIERWRALRNKANQHYEAECALHRQIREGEPDPSKVPPALRWRDGDEALCDQYGLEGMGDTVRARGYFANSEIKHFRSRSFGTGMFEGLFPPDHPETPMQPNGTIASAAVYPHGTSTPSVSYIRHVQTVDTESRDRANELIKAADGWTPAPHPLAERYAAMAAEGDAISMRLEEMAKAIVAMPAKTIPGLSAKARFAIADEVTEDEFLFNDLAESILGQLADMTEVSPIG